MVCHGISTLPFGIARFETCVWASRHRRTGWCMIVSLCSCLLGSRRGGGEKSLDTEDNGGWFGRYWSCGARLRVIFLDFTFLRIYTCFVC